MPKRPARTIATLTPSARQDIRDASRWSELKFCKAAAIRYRALLVQAFRDLEADPVRPGSKARPELMVPEVRTYHLASSRSRTEQSGVKTPRHYILYRSIAPGHIEIARILHDSSDLKRHLPRELFEQELTFDEIVRDIKTRNADTDPETLQALIDDAVRHVRGSEGES